MDDRNATSRKSRKRDEREESGNAPMNWIECCIVLAATILATVALTPLAKSIAVKADAIDYPDRRRVNTVPVPRMGGIAIFGGMIVGAIIIYCGVKLFGWSNPFYQLFGKSINYVLLGAGIVCMFAVGVVDDIMGLQPKAKFVGQVVAACLASASGLLLTNIQNPFVPDAFIEFGWLAYPITVLYLVAFANVINLIDGLDGLASSISAISAATIFVFSMLAGRYGAALVALVIVGTCLGFLKSNRHPASIFMGDSGSLLLGMMLGIVSLLAVARSTLFISLLVPIVAAGVPIIDTAVAIIRRKRAHQPVTAPDRGHIHHRLLSAGYSQNATVLIMSVWTLALAVCSIIMAESKGMIRIIVIIVIAAITAFAIGKLHLFEPVLRHHYNPRHVIPRSQRRTEDFQAEADGRAPTPAKDRSAREDGPNHR